MGSTDEMKHMIQNEIRSIRNLEERVIFKEVMEGIFLSLYETNENMYQELEARVMDELAYDMNRYLIKTGVIEKQYIDRSHHLLHPMDETDLESPTYSLSDIDAAVKGHGSYRLMRVMIQIDFLELQELWKSNSKFQGTVKLEGGSAIGFKAELHPSKSYLAHISHLYQLFSRNGIPWQTLNAPYLYKMADVRIVELFDDISGDKKIESVQVDFGKYGSQICYDLVPVWNIERIRLDTIGFPSPCEDHKNYEHILSIRNYGEEHAYLIDENSQIQSISQQNEKIVVISNTDDIKKWNIYMIKNEEQRRIERYTYPIMQNLRNENFIEKFHWKWNQEIKTKVELKRFIDGFGLDEYLEYCDCKVEKEFTQEQQTYCMNAFIEDEIRDVKYLHKLILYFKKGSCEHWLVRDIASFIVSEVQRLYPEYECGGRFL